MPIQRLRAFFVLCFVLLLFGLPGLACNLPGAGVASPTESPTLDLATLVAQTVQAELTLKAPLATDTLPLLATGTSAPPTQPLSATLTPQPTNTSAVATSSVALLSASVNTNCRAGPSKLYDPPLGVLLEGQKAEVHGRNDVGTWWYIQNPGQPGTFCWVWTETTAVEGNTAGLPVITPPPLPPTPTFTPTPGTGFTLDFSNAHDCGGTSTAIIQVDNTGNTDLESLNLKIEDLTASTTLYGPASSDAPFMATSGECPPGGDLLEAGESLYIGGPVGSGNSGHNAKATVELCTENGLDGTCVEKTIEFIIP